MVKDDFFRARLDGMGIPGIRWPCWGVVCARGIPDNPFDGHTLAAQLEQASTLLQDLDA